MGFEGTRLQDKWEDEWSENGVDDLQGQLVDLVKYQLENIEYCIWQSERKDVSKQWRRKWRKLVNKRIRDLADVMYDRDNE